jgi:hypothetical protein
MKTNLVLGVLCLAVLATLCLPADGQKSAAPPAASGRNAYQEIRLKPDAPMWERYLAAGRQFKAQGDDAKAKQYFLASLAALEKATPTKEFVTRNVVKLAQSILQMYPDNLDKPGKAEGDARIKTDEEKIGVLARLDRICKKYPKANSVMATSIEAQIRVATEDLNKPKAAVKEKANEAPHQ